MMLPRNIHFIEDLYLVVILWLVIITTSLTTMYYDRNPTHLSNEAYIQAEFVYTKYHPSNSVIAIIDFTLPSNKIRMAIVDMKSHKVILETYVAHGSGSGDLYATSFSNQVNSYKTSLGVYSTLNEYYGKHGLSLRIKGLNKGINDNVEKRNIVIHGADYIGNGKTGRSWGCFAVPQDQVHIVVKLLKRGSLLYAY